MTEIGTSAPLLEGRAKVNGALKFCGDLARPGLLHARLVTSPYAHARVDAIDTTEALQAPGVVAVLTAKDLPETAPTTRGLLLLARDRVLFVGHPLALVLAESEAAAQDGAELVFAELEPLAAAVDIDGALAPDAPAVWPEGLPGRSQEAAAHGASGGTGGPSAEAQSPNIADQVSFTRGDLEAGFSEAAQIVERTYETAAVHQSYLEPHACMVEVDPGATSATVWTSTQATFYVRDSVASILGLDNTSVRAIGTPVGGGFGGKFLLYEPLIALASKQLGRPVRHVLSRYEEMVAANPAPATRVRIKVGARADGTLTALDAELTVDSGCYPSSMVGLAGILLGSFYQAPHQKISALEVLTFKASSGAYRAPLAPQCAFALESALAELADQLDVDAIGLRLDNSSAPGDPMAFGTPWPTMGMREVLEAARNHPIWRERDAARAQGRGVGFALGGWPGGTEPAAAACALENDGTVQVRVSSVDLTGTNTSLATIAAEAFGVDRSRVRLVTGDTATGPYAGASGGSKILYTVGPAVIEAAREARRQTLELAAASFEAAPEDLEIRDGAVQVKGSPDKKIPLAKIAQGTMRYGAKQAPVLAHGRHAQQSQSPGFCAQLAEVEVDPETGHVKVHRMAVIQDVGRSINPLLIEGQMAGGAAQGIGWALLEQMLWTPEGQILTGSLTDYALPHAHDLPQEYEMVRVEVPSEHGPFGARGVGEPPVVPTAAAVANAITDATGFRARQLPMTATRVLQGLREQAAAGH